MAQNGRAPTEEGLISVQLVLQNLRGASVPLSRSLFVRFLRSCCSVSSRIHLKSVLGLDLLHVVFTAKVFFVLFSTDISLCSLCYGFAWFTLIAIVMYRHVMEMYLPQCVK
jgi:hypothetical protein